MARIYRALRYPHLLSVMAIVGMAGTFAGMILSGSGATVGAIDLVPWVVLLAFDLGPLAGVLAGLVATAMYWINAEINDFPHSFGSVVLRTLPFVVTGFAAGYAAQRIRRDSEQLQSTTALQKALLDSTLDGICLTDPTGNIVVSNEPLRQMAKELGLPNEGTVTERLLELTGRMREPERFRERMLRLARETGPSEDEFELAESERVLRGYTEPVVRADGTFVGRVWTLRDVTAERHLERMRDSFIASVSHELRTPLTSITGFLELIEDEEASLSDATRRYLGVIRRGAARLLQGVEDLLLAAQIEARRLELHPAPVDLAELAATAVEAARPTAGEKEVALELKNGHAIRVDADAVRIDQVLDNLLSNAIKFTPAGGAVTVSLSRVDGHAIVEVEDTGIGIPQEEVGHLFTRFYRASSATRRSIPGTGLGLLIARAIVEGHGGTISIASREDHGTRVTVSLPVVAAVAQSAGSTYR